MSDEVVWRGYEKLGIGREVSQNYVPQGCFEPTLMGLEEPLICCSWISIPKVIEFTLNNGVDMLTGRVSGMQYATPPATYEEFYRRFLVQLDTIVNNIIRIIDEESEYAHLINPSPLYSGTFASCIEACKGVYHGATVYPNTSVKLCGIGTTVDSLMAVKKYVYDEGRITFEELRDLLCNNWEGGEDLRLDILNEKNRYGNGLAEPDDLARDIYGKRIEVRIPFVPAFNDGEIEAIAALLSELRSLKCVKLLAYHDFAADKYAAVGMADRFCSISRPTDEQLANARAILKRALPNVIIE